MSEPSHESRLRFALCAVLIGGGALFASSISAANESEPSPRAQELFKELARKKQVQKKAIEDYEVGLRLIEKTEKAMAPVEREIEKHESEVRRLRAADHPCNRTYTNRGEFEYWQKVCGEKAQEIKRRGSALNRRYAPLVKDRDRAIGDADKGKEKYDAAEDTILTVLDTLRRTELPRICNGCKARADEVDCYLRCWDPCKKVLSHCQGNPHGATLIPPRCRCSDVPGVTYDYGRYDGLGNKVCYCSPQ